MTTDWVTATLSIAILFLCLWLTLARMIGGIRYAMPLLIWQSPGFVLLSGVGLLMLLDRTTPLKLVLVLSGLAWVYLFRGPVERQMKQRGISFRRLLFFQ